MKSLFRAFFWNVHQPDSTDIRLRRAISFWNLGIGRRLKMRDFEGYLQSIPSVPKHLADHDVFFPHLVYVEPRLSIHDLRVLAGIEFSGEDENEQFVPHTEGVPEPLEPRWMRMHSGLRNHKRAPKSCRDACREPEMPLTLLRGISFVIQEPGAVVNDRNHALVCPGTVYRSARDLCACIVRKAETHKIGLCYEGRPYERFGSATYIE